MLSIKKGTPACGILCGTGAVLLVILIMTIGFWKTLLFGIVFAIGYFSGSVQKPGNALKESINKIIPSQDPGVIDMKKSVNNNEEEKND